MHPNTSLKRTEYMEHQHSDESGFTRLFNELPKTTLPEGLYVATISSIRKAKIRAVRIRLALSASLSIVALSALFGGITYTYAQLETSGFIEYLSLALSDGTVLMLYWHDIGMSLLESLPIMGIVLILTSLVFTLYGLRFIATYAGKRHSYRFA